MINETGVDIDRSKLEIKNDEEWLWLAEYFVQFFNSPLWTVPVETYMEEHCITFENKDENAHEHYKVHKDFVKMCDGLIQDKVNDIGIDKKTFAKAVVVGLGVAQYKDFFEMLFVVDDFLVFKKSMIRKNVELNNEAMEALAEEGHQFSEEDYAQQNLQSEKEGLEMALAMSNSHHNQMSQLQQNEEQMLLEAIRLSELSYKMEQDSLASQATPPQPVPKAQVISMPAPVLKPTEPKPAPPAPVAVKQIPMPVDIPNTPLVQKLKEQREINKQVQKALPKAIPQKPVNSTGLGGLGALPSLNLRGGIGFKRPKMPEIQKRKEEIEQKLALTSQEAMESRKQKLIAQRQKLLEKKKKEREANLKKYEQLEAGVTNNGGTEMSNETKNKRKEIYAMLRR